MWDSNIIPFRGEAPKRRDHRAVRWPVQMLMTAGLLGFVCGVLYVSAPLHMVAPLGGASAALMDGTASSVAASPSVYYPNCAAARAAGAAPIRFGEPGYRAPLDADGDGVACEPYRPR